MSPSGPGALSGAQALMVERISSSVDSFSSSAFSCSVMLARPSKSAVGLHGSFSE